MVFRDIVFRDIEYPACGMTYACDIERAQYRVARHLYIARRAICRSDETVSCTTRLEARRVAERSLKEESNMETKTEINGVLPILPPPASLPPSAAGQPQPNALEEQERLERRRRRTEMIRRCLLEA